MFNDKKGDDLPKVIVDLVHGKVEECYVKAEAFFSVKLVRCQVEFGLTGKCAGRAHIGENRIRLNSIFLLRELRDMIDDTVPHEVAHVLTRRVYPKRGRVKPHGKEWKFIMEMVLDIPAIRCHTYALERVAGRYVGANKFTAQERIRGTQG